MFIIYDRVFLDPWQPTKLNIILLELDKELCKSHVLFGLELEILARRRDKDEYIFWIKQQGKFAQVHLTWRGEVESDPFWPVTTIYDTLDEWVEMVMKSDNEKYGDIED